MIKPKTTMIVGSTKEEEKRATRKERAKKRDWWAKLQARIVPKNIDNIVERVACKTVNFKSEITLGLSAPNIE